VQPLLLVCASSHPLVLLLACASVTPAGIPWFHNDITHLVVVDSLKQPLASKSDRRPVGTLHRYCALTADLAYLESRLMELEKQWGETSSKKLGCIRCLEMANILARLVTLSKKAQVGPGQPRVSL
jgi:hypothetical protein